MNYWFECKVSYERQADSMGMKKVSESYLVDALSFTEAEERIIKEVSPFVSVGELSGAARTVWRTERQRARDDDATPRPDGR